MRYLFLLLPFCVNTLYSQNIDIKPVNGKVVIQLDTLNYLIKRDTTNGVINISFIPTAQIQKELQSQLNSLDGELASVQEQLDFFQTKKKELIRRRKEVATLLTKVQVKSKK